MTPYKKIDKISVRSFKKKNLEIVILKVVEIKGKIYFHKLKKFEKKKMWEMIVIIEVVKIKVYTYFLQNLRKNEKKKKGKEKFYI